MASSGTYSFAPSAGDIVLNAFAHVQLRRWELTIQHLEDAAMQANMLMVDFSNRNPNRWAMETQDFSLSQGVATYNLATRTVAIAIAYIDTEVNDQTNSRVIGPFSATDYAAVPVKEQQAPPTAYFFSLLTPTPTITLWPVPDGNGPYLLRVQTFRQMQDVVLAGGVGVDTPFRFLDAFTTGLAARLARLYPEKLKNPVQDRQELEGLYKERFGLAAAQDQERTPMRVQPDFSGYYR